MPRQAERWEVDGRKQRRFIAPVRRSLSRSAKDKSGLFRGFDVGIGPPGASFHRHGARQFLVPATPPYSPRWLLAYRQNIKVIKCTVTEWETITRAFHKRHELESSPAHKAVVLDTARHRENFNPASNSYSYSPSPESSAIYWHGISELCTRVGLFRRRCWIGRVGFQPARHVTKLFYECFTALHKTAALSFKPKCIDSINYNGVCDKNFVCNNM